ncbi:MAG: flagellar hook-associated protein FlgK [Gemmatimonadota bacterium]
MSTLGSILNIARSAIHTHQTAVRVASQNISNAQTEGYSRQRVQLVDTQPDITPLGRLGTGVRIHDISRVRDTLLDTSFRREAGRSASFGMRQELLGRVEEILDEPSDTGLAASLDAFFSSWSDVASRPTDDTARRLVVQRGQQVASNLSGFSERLDELVQSTRGRLTTTVSEVNRLAEQIASVNGLIVREEASGLTASDLRDQRDRLIDSLSQLTSVRTSERDNGSLAVLVENALIVEGTDWKSLAATGEPPVVTLGSATLNVATEGSVLGELVTTLQTRIPGVQQRLDDLAEGLVVQTNALHRAGFLPDGTAGGDFFDPAATTARQINVVATGATIAASDDATQPGNNRIALAMTAMRGDPADNDIGIAIWTAAEAGILGDVSAGEHYRATVSELAVETRKAEDSASVYEALASQLDLRRQSVSGVSTDEELIRVMQHQQAYTAAARMVTVVDEMLQTVLDMKR